MSFKTQQLFVTYSLVFLISLDTLSRDFIIYFLNSIKAGSLSSFAIVGLSKKTLYTHT